MTFGYGFEKGNPANQFVKDIQAGVESNILAHIGIQSLFSFLSFLPNVSMLT